MPVVNTVYRTDNIHYICTIFTFLQLIELAEVIIKIQVELIIWVTLLPNYWATILIIPQILFFLIKAER